MPLVLSEFISLDGVIQAPGARKELVDELNLMIEPVILGGGKRLFPSDGVLRGFELVSSTTASTGVQICKYQRS